MSARKRCMRDKSVDCATALNFGRVYFLLCARPELQFQFPATGGATEETFSMFKDRRSVELRRRSPLLKEKKNKQH